MKFYKVWIYFLFSLYFTHCFAHYLRIHKPGWQDVPLVVLGHIYQTILANFSAIQHTSLVTLLIFLPFFLIFISLNIIYIIYLLFISILSYHPCHMLKISCWLRNNLTYLISYFVWHLMISTTKHLKRLVCTYVKDHQLAQQLCNVYLYNRV